MDIQSADVWSEGITASAKLAAPAGYDYLVGDYVALTGPAVEKFLAMAKQFTTPEELAGVSRYTFVTYVGLKSLAHAMQECGKDRFSARNADLEATFEGAGLTLAAGDTKLRFEKMKSEPEPAAAK